jgi:SAM-dependent methyltransferase
VLPLFTRRTSNRTGLAAGVTWRNYPLESLPLLDEPEFPRQPFSLAIPNEILRASSSVSDLSTWFAIGEAWAHLVVRFLPDAPTVLDVGCGCGKLARFLYLVPRLNYLGIDLFRPGIEWSRRAFSELGDGRFRFEHFDGHSEVYNPTGTILPSEFQFPVADSTVDMVVCASLFTHLFESDAYHYLNQIYRSLRSGGCALISIHDKPSKGSMFSGDPARIDIDLDYFVSMGKQAGLSMDKQLGIVYGQTVLLFRKP